MKAFLDNILGSLVSLNNKTYNVERLWELTKDSMVESVPVKSFSDQLHTSVWSQHNLTPIDVIDHMERILSSDLSHPIIVLSNGNGDWKILDGVHRLCKAIGEGKQNILARFITGEYLENNYD